jgi:hypothetical protein
VTYTLPDEAIAPDLKIEHGSLTAYKIQGCRCKVCTEAQRVYNAQRERKILYGQWQPFVDAQPAREHVLALVEQGMSWKRTADLAGIAASTVSALLYGKPGKQPPTRIRPQTATALLAVREALDSRTDMDRVDCSGTRRRIQALVAAGWSITKLGAEIGITTANMHGSMRRAQVSAATARKVRDLYERLWDMAPPEATHLDKIAASRSRNRAKANGWHPPMAWDDDLLDLPDNDLDQELRRRAELMDDREVRRCYRARHEQNDTSPLVDAGAQEHVRRRRTAVAS